MEEEWPPINPNRNNYIWWHNYATRWSDNDIYGHVNNNIYYSMFDTVVNYFLTQIFMFFIISEQRCLPE